MYMMLNMQYAVPTTLHFASGQEKPEVLAALQVRLIFLLKMMTIHPITSAMALRANQLTAREKMSALLLLNAKTVLIIFAMEIPANQLRA